MSSRKTKPANKLLQAVEFVSMAQSGRGPETATHSIVRYGRIVASDRMLAAGSPIEEDDLNCAPNTALLALALSKCVQEHAIVEQDRNLFVRAGDFSAFVPLCDPGLLNLPVADERTAPLGDEFRAALKVTGILVREAAPTVIQSAIQLNAFSCCSTNGNVILEAWHGYDMPPGVVIPKAFADAVCKTSKKIACFGFSDQSFTVHFEDGCWIKTLQYTEPIPDIVGKLADVEQWTPFDPLFFRHVEEIGKWSQDGKVYLHDSLLSSHAPSAAASGSIQTYPQLGMKQGICYSVDSLARIAKIATHFNDQIKPGVTMFCGKNLRGAVAHESIQRSSNRRLCFILNRESYVETQNNVDEETATQCLEVTDIPSQEQAFIKYKRYRPLDPNKPCKCGSGQSEADCDICIPF